MYEQQEYLLAYGMVFAFLILGMLVVCIPRPRKNDFVIPEEAAKAKRIKQGNKVKNKAKKKTDKIIKNKAKAHAKKVKARQ